MSVRHTPVCTRFDIGGGSFLKWLKAALQIRRFMKRLA